MPRIAVVTGGTRGIGRAICGALKEADNTVVALYAGNEAAAEEARQELGIKAYKCDVGDPEQCETTLAKIEDEVGPIDIVVNNAGITWDAMMHRMTYEQWASVVQTNLTSMFNMVRPVLNGMRDRGWGRIINISSINGQKGQMGQTNYSAAKAGVIGFTKALAQETARKGVTVNCVAPGYVDTDMVAAVPEDVLNGIIAAIPVGRLGKADEIAQCVAYIASEQAAFMTGATVTINGGQYITG